MYQGGLATGFPSAMRVETLPCRHRSHYPVHLWLVQGTAFLHDDKLQVVRMPKYLADLIIKVDPEAREYLQPDGSLLVEVLRALYGFPESAKLWNEPLTTSLFNGGYKQCPVEQCLFRKSIGEGKAAYKL